MKHRAFEREQKEEGGGEKIIGRGWWGTREEDEGNERSMLGERREG
jgi:hypothetical protein